jgi:hypothetical protein
MSRDTNRQTIPGGKVQGPTEDNSYILDTTRWGGGPSNVVVRVIRESDDEDVAATTTPGVFPINGDNITLRLFNLEADEFYFVEVDFATLAQPNGVSTWFTLPCN